MFRLLITSLILLITMNSCDKTLATYSMKVEGKDIVITDVVYIMADGNDIDLLNVEETKEILRELVCPIVLQHVDVTSIKKPFIMTTGKSLRNIAQTTM